jgi:hypothetical protein
LGTKKKKKIQNALYRIITVLAFEFVKSRDTISLLTSPQIIYFFQQQKEGGGGVLAMDPLIVPKNLIPV